MKKLFNEIGDDEKKIIATLREEAKEVKDCFTKFSFQAIVFTSIVLGVISKYHEEFLVTSIACVSVVFVLLSVARIGTYKYGTANRNFGYELHLYRSRYSKETEESCQQEDSIPCWQNYMRKIGWEESMRAWRVVQATVYNEIYKTSKFWPEKLKDKKRFNYKWFEPGSLIVKDSNYHAGSYLKTMLRVLHTLTFLALVLFGISIARYFTLNTDRPIWEFYLAISAFIALLIFILIRVLRTNARRKILESGLLSIHSCAIMWQAVVTAHYRALHETFKKNRQDAIYYRGYTKNLSIQAKDLKQQIDKIHYWIHSPAKIGDS